MKKYKGAFIPGFHLPDEENSDNEIIDEESSATIRLRQSSSDNSDNTAADKMNSPVPKKRGYTSPAADEDRKQPPKNRTTQQGAAVTPGTERSKTTDSIESYSTAVEHNGKKGRLLFLPDDNSQPVYLNGWPADLAAQEIPSIVSADKRPGNRTSKTKQALPHQRLLQETDSRSVTSLPREAAQADSFTAARPVSSLPREAARAGGFTAAHEASDETTPFKSYEYYFGKTPQRGLAQDEDACSIDRSVNYNGEHRSETQDHEEYKDHKLQSVLINYVWMEQLAAPYELILGKRKKGATDSNLQFAITSIGSEFGFWSEALPLRKSKYVNEQVENEKPGNNQLVHRVAYVRPVVRRVHSLSVERQRVSKAIADWQNSTPLYAKDQFINDTDIPTWKVVFEAKEGGDETHDPRRAMNDVLTDEATAAVLEHFHGGEHSARKYLHQIAQQEPHFRRVEQYFHRPWYSTSLVVTKYKMPPVDEENHSVQKSSSVRRFL